MKPIIYFLLIGILLTSCHQDEIDVYDQPFVHINFNNVSSVNINSNRKDIVSYYIYLSTKPLAQDMLMDYSIIVGDGLKENVDFKIITQEYPLIFPSGIYRRQSVAPSRARGCGVRRGWAWAEVQRSARASRPYRRAAGTGRARCRSAPVGAPH